MEYDADSVERERVKYEGDETTEYSKQRKAALALLKNIQTANQELFHKRKTFTETGVWISAAETSEDWATSNCRNGGFPPRSSPSISSSSQVGPPSPSKGPPKSTTGGNPSNTGDEDPYDSDLEDGLYIEYQRLVNEIYGPQHTQRSHELG